MYSPDACEFRFVLGMITRDTEQHRLWNMYIREGYVLECRREGRYLGICRYHRNTGMRIHRIVPM